MSKTPVGSLPQIVAPQDGDVFLVERHDAPTGQHTSLVSAAAVASYVAGKLSTVAPSPGGASLNTFEFQQSQPSTAWTVVHNRNGKPSVTIVDTAGDIVETAYLYVDNNTVLITFAAPCAGIAYLN